MVCHLLGHDLAVPLDVEGFTACEGVKKPLRVLHTIETTRRVQLTLIALARELDRTLAWIPTGPFQINKKPS